jgi:TRAP-type mannitol/chloroaromatic compound transport system substrate-binding protein
MKRKNNKFSLRQVDMCRRRFVAGGVAVAASGIVGGISGCHSHMVPIRLRLQSTWPANDIFHEYATDLAARVNVITEGRVKIDLLPAGAVVKAFDLLDAVHRGLLDGGHGVAAYWYGKNAAYSLFGTGPSFGMDGQMFLAWYKYGGGKALYEELIEHMGLDVTSMLYGPMPTQPLGWFKAPPHSLRDLRGLRYRTAGLSLDLAREMGMLPVAMPSGEILDAFENDVIDAAEFNNVSSDSGLGLSARGRICMLWSFHQATECFELVLNRSKYASLGPALQSLLEIAVEASSADVSWKSMTRYAKDYADMRATGVRFERTPVAILEAQLAAWDRVVAAYSAQNPMFAKIVESQREFAKQVVGWWLDTTVPADIAYDHYF